ncbi:BASIC PENTACYSTEINE protein [Rhynchospora pubera]|uniref:GAGA-binding transcriptional activator n=1 Tax=Rhynchospora pubera TaxID=906938 RepID=A0AAV8HHL7_9POAL|nr:BASIC PENTACYSTEINE protein [Rhynchospora pubera]KAJ4762648.1 BASIC PENTACYSTEINE protein [Rhynchospora pubera]KAJ4791313.1 BASIC PENTACYSTEINE protein [Rhynchospora pubera]KAJ4815146.1 BASIC PENTACYSTEINE protein [Rhynchospora pubera]
MDDDSSMRWGSIYDHSIKPSNMGHGLQLMPSLNERETKPHLCFSTGATTFNPEPTVPTMGLMRSDYYMHPYREAPSTNPHHPSMHHTNHLNRIPQYYESPMCDTSMVHTLQILNPPDVVPLPESNPLDGMNDNPKKKKKKKKPQGELVEKQPKLKKPKKEASSSDGTGKKERNKDGEMERILINGMEIDLAKLPTPVCSCTGSAQQCYRWGVGGWQSACCTNTISMYPLPLSDKRRGARIAGRKMSLGAFRKVLERVAGEGIDLSQPIDLRNFWAKHGTNKFVTIR